MASSKQEKILQMVSWESAPFTVRPNTARNCDIDEIFLWACIHPAGHQGETDCYLELTEIPNARFKGELHHTQQGLGKPEEPSCFVIIV